jgi:RHS repeat-associated protein
VSCASGFGRDLSVSPGTHRSSHSRYGYAFAQRQRLTGVVEANSGGSVIFQATYTYDALDRRIETQVDSDGSGPNPPVTTWTVYDGENPYADFSASGVLQTRYLNGTAVDSLLARTSSSGGMEWYLDDRMGSVRIVANSQGSMVGGTLVLYQAAYDAYGNKTSSSGTGGDRFGYTGRESDASGLQYNRGRYYDPSTGRWTQQDPLGFAAGDANLYRYVGNQPTGYIDPSGLRPALAKGKRSAVPFSGAWAQLSA